MNDVEHGLTKENFLSAFPIALRETPELMALAAASAETLEKRAAETGRARIYPDAASLPEDLLDILAIDFKIDWWDPNYSLEEKQRIFRDSWYVHKHLGTKAAVTTALRAVYPKAVVEEWFDYGGEPYHFKLKIDLSGETSDAARPWRALERVNFYKSLRSHIDAFEFTMNAPPVTLHVGGGAGRGSKIGVPRKPDTHDFRAEVHTGGSFWTDAQIGVPLREETHDFQAEVHAGGAFGADAGIGVPLKENAHDFHAEIHTGGAFGVDAKTGVPADRTPPELGPAIVRTGCVCTIISRFSGGINSI